MSEWVRVYLKVHQCLKSLSTWSNGVYCNLCDASHILLFPCTNDDNNENTCIENLNKLIQPIIKNSALKFWTMNCVNMESISSVFTIKELVVEMNSLLTLRLLMSYIYIYIYIYIYMEHLFLMFLDHTQRRSTVGRTPLDE